MAQDPVVAGRALDTRLLAARGWPLWLAWLVDSGLCLAKILWLCGIATLMLVLAALAFIWNDQGQELLRMVSEPTPAMSGVSAPAGLLGTVILWSLASWYTSRLLLIRQLPGFPLPTFASAGLRTWIPRIFGGAAPLIVGVAFVHLGAPDHRDFIGSTASVWASVYLVLAVALFVFYWQRRKWFPEATGRIDVRAHLPTLPRASWIVVGISIALSFALLLLFVAAPVGPARFLGTAAVFISAASAILLSGSILLTYAPLAAGYPSLILPVLVWAVVWSPWNDNHPIRTLPAPVDVWEREDPVKQLHGWLEQARSEEGPATGQSDPSRPYPVFIVAAAGGGIRAAYWTAAVLGAAAAESARNPGGHAQAWKHHLFALSGVSGGSLGAAVHVVELSRPEPASTYVQRVDGMLGEDHLSPVVSFMLYPDLFQRFVPGPVRRFDRARALESSWEDSANRYLGGDAFSGPMRALWAGSRRYALPSLLLNSTRVETGQRVIVSNLVIPDDFMDAVDLIGQSVFVPPAAAAQPATIAPQKPPSPKQRDPLLRRLDSMALSAAVHLSARFTYVSPAARVERRDGALWGRLVDGGYFENSGAATAADLIRTICPDWRPEGHGGSRICNTSDATTHAIIPVVLLIKNDAYGPSLCDPYTGPQSVSHAPLTETRPPIDALLATREARGRLAERSIVRLVEGQDIPSGNCDQGCVLELSLAPASSVDKRFKEPPLGWSLSESSRRAIQERLQDGDIRGQLQCLADLSTGQSCSTAMRCGR